MIEKAICDAANEASAQLTEAEAKMRECGDDPPSPDKYNEGMELVAAARRYADTLEAYLNAMKREFL